MSHTRVSNDRSNVFLRKDIVALKQENENLRNEVEELKKKLNEVVDQVQALMDIKRLGVIDANKEEYVKKLTN